MRQRFLAGFTLVALSAAACAAPQGTSTGTTGSAADEQAVRALANRYAVTFNSRTPDSLAPAIATDYEDMDAMGRHAQGRDALLKEFRDDIATMPPGQMTITTTFVKWLSDRAAVSGGTWQMSGLPAGAPDRGAWTLTAVKKDSTWQIVSSMSSTDDSKLMQSMMPDTSKHAKPKGT